MNRDTVKTLAGLVIIGVIVVATFLYGNAQRQSQLKHDASVKQTQTATVASGGAKASPSASVAATAAPAASSKTATNTAPVQSPGSSSIQGGGATSTPASTPKPTLKPTPAPTQAPAAGQVAGAATVPQAGGSTAPLPQTGTSAPLAGVVGLAAIATMWLWVRRSKRAVLTAARANRS